MAAKINRVTYTVYVRGYKGSQWPEREEKKPEEWISVTIWRFSPSFFQVLRLLLSKPLRNLWFAKNDTFFRLINNVALRAMLWIILFEYPSETRENKEATVHKPVLQRLSNQSRVSSSTNI